MEKALTLLLIAAALFLVFGPDAYGMGSRPQQELGARFETHDLIGTEVKNPGGEVLGSIREFVIDQDGHVVFAVLSHEGKEVGVPFGALSISGPKPGEVKIVLDMDRARLDAAPSFDRTKAIEDRHWASEVYRYFGQRPYWTTPAEEPPSMRPTSPMELGY